VLKAVVRGGAPVLLWRAALVAALLCGVGLLPWLSRTDPALTVLRARSAERAPTPEVLDAIRAQLGLDAGPLKLLGDWFGGLLHGDAGRSWISGAEVTPSVLQALGVSLLLMGGSLAVAVLTAGAVCARTLRLGAGHRTGHRTLRFAVGWRTRRFAVGRRLDGRRSAGTGSALLSTLPDFLTASVLAAVVGVQLGWLPALGWYGPQWMVLPALSLGLPAGALLGRMLDDLLPGAFAEQWALAAAARGVPGRSIARQALRRCVPGLLPNFGLFVVGLTGGAVAVEQVFDIPGLGRLTLQAAVAQDLPVLQAGALALVLLAAIAGGLTRLTARLLIGPALRDGALSSLHRPTPPRPTTLPLLYGGLLLGVVALGLARDPLRLDTTARLQSPSWAHPFGTDGLGRDVLARVGHGALSTLALALAVSAAALVLGVLLGLLPRFSGPLVDTVNAVPPVLAALLVTGVAGSGPSTPALAVTAVAWAPLAAHTSALLQQERATTHLTATRGWARARSNSSATNSSRPSCPRSYATHCSACPASPWPSQPSASWASARSRRPRSGACSCPRTSRTRNGRPGRYWPPPPHSPCWGRWPSQVGAGAGCGGPGDRVAHADATPVTPTPPTPARTETRRRRRGPDHRTPPARSGPKA
jgi:peptide/nickel transport system permease protein